MRWMLESRSLWPDPRITSEGMPVPAISIRVARGLPNGPCRKPALMRRHAVPSHRVAGIGRHVFHPAIALLNLAVDSGRDRAPDRSLVDVHLVADRQIAELGERDRPRRAEIERPAEIARGDLALDVLVGLERIDLAELEVRHIAAERAHSLEHLGVRRHQRADP